MSLLQLSIEVRVVVWVRSNCWRTSHWLQLLGYVQMTNNRGETLHGAEWSWRKNSYSWHTLYKKYLRKAVEMKDSNLTHFHVDSNMCNMIIAAN